MARPDHPAIVAGSGTGFVLIGLGLFLQEVDLLSPGWSVLLPVIAIVVGIIVAASGAIGAHRGRAG